jgi:hypothetical protein
MPPKKAATNRKTTKTRDADEDDDGNQIYTPSVAGSELESEVDPVESDVSYKIQSIQSTQLRDLLDFLQDPKMINQSGNPTTNIINRQSGICYNIPDKKLPKFFKLLEACRRVKIKMMMTEKQQPYSGIMLDFDVYQDTDADQITDEMFFVLCQKIVELLMKILNFGDVKKETIYIGITRRPKITFSDEKDCHKDGFHIIIPGIKVSKGVKKLLISKLLDNEVLDQLLADVIPAEMKVKGEAYQRKHFLDTMSVSVPVFYIGSSTKKGHAAYHLSHIYEATVNFETRNIMLIRNETMLHSKSINICNEFSLSYEAVSGVIKKRQYEPQEKFKTEVIDLEKASTDDEEVARNHGMLSMNSIHDAQIKEIKDLLDTLHVKRADNYGLWLNVLYALANASPSYRDLAEYFSRKSSKFKMPDFEKYWTQALKGPTGGRKALTIGSLHYWARKDNPERYNQLRKQTIYQILYNMVYEGYKEGILSHSDIAELCHKLLKHKYITSIPEGEKIRCWYEFILDEDEHRPGELYKWRKWPGQYPISLSRYISETLPNLFEMVFKSVKKNFENSSGDISKYYKKVLDNFKGTMRKLGDRNFKKNVLMEAEDKFSNIGFAETLDKDPLVRGVANGILKLSISAGGKPQLVQGYHTYPVSKYTDVPYIPFNPRDPLTKEILITLRKLFPDNEPDTFEFMMYYFASTIDGNPKESMFMMLVGKGSNGKTFLVELHKSTIGSIYGVKLPLSYLTGKSANADNATPAQMMLKDATLAYYSESNRHEILNAARVKEVTGLETIAGRKLHQDMINFKPRCHHLATTNYDFDIECNDHGTWRRMEYITLKITFVDPAVTKYDPSDPFQRIANDKVTQEWTESPEVRGRYLGFMVWMHYWLYRKYNGKVKRVPHKHVQFETNKYRVRQDTISAFLAQRFVKVADETAQYSMIEEVQKYIRWYSLNHGGILPAKGISEMFQNSPIGNHIKTMSRGLYLMGHRFLDNGEKLEEGEEYAMKHIFDMEIPPDNFGIASETPDQYYDRICNEYDQYKDIFTGDAQFDVDVNAMPERLWSDDVAEDDVDDPIARLAAPNIPDEMPREDNLEINGRILPSGIVLKQMEEPSVNYLTDEFHSSMTGYLPVDVEDSDYEGDD